MPLLVESHNHHGSAVRAAFVGEVDEGLFTFLEAERVDDGLALYAFQSRFDYLPLTRINHNRHAGNIGFRSDKVEEVLHGINTIEHAFIHIDVDDLRAALNLLSRDI